MQEMSYNRFIKCVEQIMMLDPSKMPPEQGRKVVSYRARRFLLSVAGLLGLSDKGAASVGKGRGGLRRSEILDLRYHARALRRHEAPDGGPHKSRLGHCPQARVLGGG